MTQQQRTALVTGGMGGLGEAIARQPAVRGPPRAADPTRDEAQPTRAGPRSGPRPTHSRPTRGRRGRLGILPAHGRAHGRRHGHQVDIVVNNAGITRDGTLRKLGKDGWDAVLRTNLDRSYDVTKPFLDGMLERGWGRVINISSINGLKGQFGQTNYSAAKAGMHGFTKALAQEVARKGVTVNTVSPGYLATKMVTAVPSGRTCSRSSPASPSAAWASPPKSPRSSPSSPARPQPS